MYERESCCRRPALSTGGMSSGWLVWSLAVDVEQQIRAYIVENFLLGEDGGLDGSASLLESGVMDSTGAMELVLFLEQAFNIKIDDEDLVPENLDTIRDIAAFVQRKQGAGNVSVGKTGGVTET